MSRRSSPKQFLRLPDGRSLLQTAYARALADERVARVMTLTTREHTFRCLDELQALAPAVVEKSSFIVEPEARGTAGAVALAALAACETAGDDAALVIMPADHFVDDARRFWDSVRAAETSVRAGRVVTFGIVPTRVESGFGYIVRGAPIDAVAASIDRFVEKPDTREAAALIDARHALWNAGIFCARAGTLRDAFREVAPQVLDAAQRALASAQRNRFFGAEVVECAQDAYARCPNVSFDHAVMEKTRLGAVVPAAFAWADVGSWESFAEFFARDADGNRTTGDVHTRDTRDCVVAANGRLIATLGVSGLAIVETPDALLVADRGRVQEVKQLVDALASKGRAEALETTTIYRPWGHYTVLEEGAGVRIKRIEVKPASSLSLQSHRHRSEHWVVVSGEAEVTRGEAVFRVRENESTFIPARQRHRLANASREAMLVVIEVECGDYIGEDDIERYEDAYGRSSG